MNIYPQMKPFRPLMESPVAARQGLLNYASVLKSHLPGPLRKPMPFRSLRTLQKRVLQYY